MKPKQRKIPTVNQLFIFFFFFTVKLPEFSQLVIWGKCLQQNVYSKDSTREVPRTERAKHFHGPNSGYSLRRRPVTSQPQESEQVFAITQRPEVGLGPIAPSWLPNCCHWKASVCVPLR